MKTGIGNNNSSISFETSLDLGRITETVFTGKSHPAQEKLASSAPLKTELKKRKQSVSTDTYKINKTFYLCFQLIGFLKYLNMK